MEQLQVALQALIRSSAGPDFGVSVCLSGIIIGKAFSITVGPEDTGRAGHSEYSGGSSAIQPVPAGYSTG